MPKRTKEQKPKRQAKGAQKSKVLYPTVKVEVCDGKNALTAQRAKELLGWEEETEDKDFGSDYLLRDENGIKVRCKNNDRNRPLYKSNLEALKQELLQGRWKLNGEPIIIGRTGRILNGQHSLIALVLADQVYRKNELWKSVRPKPPVMPRVIVYGVKEDDATVNTMDTCKSRSLFDVLYRSTYFIKSAPKERRLFARMTDYAVRLLWARTRAMENPYAPRRTHSESLDFIDRHPRILSAVDHIYGLEKGQKAVSRFMSPGYAAGLLYLMGSSASEGDSYFGGERKEEALDWSNWEKACDFWYQVASGQIEAVKEAIVSAMEEVGRKLTARELCTMFVKAWNLFVSGKELKATAIKPVFQKDELGLLHLDENPTVGGIDLGEKTKEEFPPMERTPDPTPEEIKERAEKVRKESLRKTRSKKKKEIAVGNKVWVVEPDAGTEGAWAGKLVEVYDGPNGKIARVKVAQGFAGAGKEYEVPFEYLQTDQPV